MKSFFIKVKIFLYAFAGYAFWRVRYNDKAISKLLTIVEAFDVFIINNKSTMFIDYSYAERLF